MEVAVSLWSTVPVRCPHCGASHAVQMADSLNAVRTPWAHDAARDGILHRVDCGCGERLQLERAFSYLDVARGHWIAVHPPERWVEGVALEAQGRRVFQDVTARAAPAWVDHAVTLRLRVVFGLDALAEKLRVWEAGLDDALVELWKIDLRAARPELGPLLRVAAVEADRLVFTDGEVAVAADRARYAALLASREAARHTHAPLFSGLWVDARRQL